MQQRYHYVCVAFRVCKALCKMSLFAAHSTQLRDRICQSELEMHENLTDDDLISADS